MITFVKWINKSTTHGVHSMLMKLFSPFSMIVDIIVRIFEGILKLVNGAVGLADMFEVEVDAQKEIHVADCNHRKETELAKLKSPETSKKKS